MIEFPNPDLPLLKAYYPALERLNYTEAQYVAIDRLRQLLNLLVEGKIGFEVYQAEVRKQLATVG